MNPTGPDRRSRARGCLLGGALGDALGAPVERWSLERILGECGPDGVTEMLPAYGRVGGAITDDTQMTLFAVEGLVDVSGQHSRPDSVHAAFLRWYRTQTEPRPATPGASDVGLLRQGWIWSVRGPGRTCLSALGSGVAIGTNAENSSKGCGTVMRSAPFGFGPSPIEHAATSSRHTHGHPTAEVAASFLAQMIHLVLEGRELLPAVVETRRDIVERFPDSHDETTALVDRAVQQSHDGPPSPAELETLGAGWIAEEALGIAILIALTATGWRDALTRAVTHSGDSDSTGAVTGNILGSLWGHADLPSDWLASLEGRDQILTLADAMCDMGQAHLFPGV